MEARMLYPQITLLLAVPEFQFLFIFQIFLPARNKNSVYVHVQNALGICPALEPSPTSVYAVKKLDEILLFIASSKFGYCAYFLSEHGQDKCVCSSVICTNGWINFPCMLCYWESLSWPPSVLGAFRPVLLGNTGSSFVPSLERNGSRAPRVWNRIQLSFKKKIK